MTVVAVADSSLETTKLDSTKSVDQVRKRPRDRMSDLVRRVICVRLAVSPFVHDHDHGDERDGGKGRREGHPALSVVSGAELPEAARRAIRPQGRVSLDGFPLSTRED